MPEIQEPVSGRFAVPINRSPVVTGGSGTGDGAVQNRSRSGIVKNICRGISTGLCLLSLSGCGRPSEPAAGAGSATVRAAYPPPVWESMQIRGTDYLFPGKCQFGMHVPGSLRINRALAEKYGLSVEDWSYDL